MTVHQHPTASNVPPAVVLRVLEQFNRAELEGFISIAIGLLDVTDGDPDAEDATNLEDDFVLSDNALLDGATGPGCTISDAGEDDDPCGQCDEDGINTALFVTHCNIGPGCVISDSDLGEDGL